MLIAVPVGLMSAVYLSEYAGSRFRAWAKPLLEVLAGIPTVVYGFFAALTVAPFFSKLGLSIGWNISPESALAAGVVMGIMIIPFVSSLSDDVINAVPQSLRDGSYGLGATQSETIKQVVLPAALPGDAVDNPAYETTEPDQALWSESRKQQYELARQAVDGPPVAVLSIDHLGIEVPVYDGTSEDVLNRGVGRIEGTARVDHEGNLGIAGHRDSFFRPLKDIEIGDMMELQTGEGIVTYAVSSIEIVEPEDVFVLAPTSERTLTLVTCYPFYYVGHAPKRYIVKATAEHSFGQNLK